MRSGGDWYATVVVASLHGLAVILAGAGDLDDYFHASLELIAVAFIIWQAWSWERPSGNGHLGGDARTTLKAPSPRSVA